MSISRNSLIAPGIAVCAGLVVALALFPAVLVTARPRGWSRRARLIGASALVLALALVVLVVVVAQAYRRPGNIFLGDYLAQGGA